jgi:hypothetical protein
MLAVFESSSFLLVVFDEKGVDRLLIRLQLGLKSCKVSHSSPLEPCIDFASVPDSQQKDGEQRSERRFCRFCPRVFRTYVRLRDRVSFRSLSGVRLR